MKTILRSLLYLSGSAVMYSVLTAQEKLFAWSVSVFILTLTLHLLYEDITRR